MPPVSSQTLLPPGPQSPCDLERLDDKLQRMHVLWRQYGDCFRVPAASRDADTIVINNPDWVRRVLVSNHRNYTKGVGIERVRVLLGNGLMASEGERWRRQRRLLQAGFHKPRIEGFFEIYYRQAMQVADRCRDAAQRGEPVNITAVASETTLLAVLQSLFSEDLERLQQAQGVNPFQLVSENSNRDLQFAVKFRALGKLVQQVMDWRRSEQRFPPDLLSHCLLARDKRSGEPMSDRQLVDEVLTLVVAGHETTAASLNWLWYLLALHPQVFDKIAAEARALALSAVPDWGMLESMQWIPWAIRETLRLYPPGWLYTRRAIAADRFGDYRVPGGSDVFICAWLLHRHPAFWEQPEAFLPERFSPQQEQRRHTYCYVPFSAGPRHCIGESFAMAEMMIHLAVLAARLRPLAVEPRNVALEAEVNLRPSQPLYVTFAADG